MSASTAIARPVTVAESVRRGAERLAARGVRSPRLDAELLLAAALGVDRSRVWIDGARPLDGDGCERYEQAVRRREAREPLQRIRGTQEFYSRPFDVGRLVLIPRPETEIVVEAALAAVAHVKAPRIVDLGTGSGAIAITLALEVPAATVVATDVSEAAVAATRANAGLLGVADRVEVRRGDWADPCTGERFDLVVSNPPYVRRDEIAALEPEVRDFEPRIALDGGADGLDAYRRLAATADSILDPNGALVVEIGYQQRTSVVSLFTERSFALRAIRTDLAGIERVLVFALGEAARG